MTYPMIKLMLLSLFVITIGADDALMKKECHYTYYQSQCLICLESDPTSHQANRVGLARIVIRCLESHLQILIKIVTSISSRVGEDEATKKVLEDCNGGFWNATLELGDAEYHLLNRSYDKAIGCENIAFSYLLTCRDNLQKLKFTESPEVYDQIGYYGQLSSAARTMIQRLKSFI